MTTCVWFDLETGGFSYSHPIIQIAAIASEDGVEIDFFERKLVFSEDDADPRALEFNTYDAEVWAREAVPPAHAVTDFSAFCVKHATKEAIVDGAIVKVAQLAGHGVRTFDIPRLVRLYAAHGAWLPACVNEPIDTNQKAVRFFRGVSAAPENMKLGTLAQHFNVDIEGELHDALVDVRTSLAVGNHLWGRA